jgi:hypothetical protein
MFKPYKSPEKVNFQQLNELISKLNISGFTGTAYNGEDLLVTFEREKDLSPSQISKLNSIIENYVYEPSLGEIRALRRPLLEEADWRFNKAIDEDNLELVEAIKKYRTELRDITLQDRSQLVWPEKPWG